MILKLPYYIIYQSLHIDKFLTYMTYFLLYKTFIHIRRIFFLCNKFSLLKLKLDV